MILIVYRIIRGPSVMDRVLALDLLITASIGMICASSMLFEKAVYIDVVVIMALLAFLGTVAFSYYFQNKE
ncbi:MAG: monovalent cation/H+ antiporter complex subunit F [Cytophagaceae bacterium]